MLKILAKMNEHKAEKIITIYSMNEKGNGPYSCQATITFYIDDKLVVSSRTKHKKRKWCSMQAINIEICQNQWNQPTKISMKSIIIKNPFKWKQIDQIRNSHNEQIKNSTVLKIIIVKTAFWCTTDNLIANQLPLYM